MKRLLLCLMLLAVAAPALTMTLGCHASAGIDGN